MLNGKHFIVVKKLKTSQNGDGDLISYSFDSVKLLEGMGTVEIVDYKIEIDFKQPNFFFLVLVCKEIIKVEASRQNKPEPRKEPLIRTYPPGSGQIS